MQLGAVLKCSIASELGLGRSFLERLMSLPLFARNVEAYRDHGNYDPLLVSACTFHNCRRKTNTRWCIQVTKLVDNYRSHAAILRVYSHQFYNDELQVCADDVMTRRLCEWSELTSRRKDFPLLFHGVRVRRIATSVKSQKSYFELFTKNIILQFREKNAEKATTLPGSTQPKLSTSPST